MGTIKRGSALERLEGLEWTGPNHSTTGRARSSRLVGALLAVVMVAGGLAVASRVESIPDADADDTGEIETDLVVDDGQAAPEAAGAAPGDPITLTVIIETVDASGAPIATSQAFDVNAVAEMSAVLTPLPALDTSTVTARPDRASFTVVAGDIGISVPPPAGWSTRSVRCGTADVAPVFAPRTGEWIMRTELLADTTCRIVQANDGASVTVIARTVDRSGVEVPTASDLRFRWSTGLGAAGATGSTLLDTDPFSGIPATTSFEGPPERWTITQDANDFGPLVSVVCDGADVPLISSYPPGQLPRSGVSLDIAGPITCVFTTMEMEGLHTVRVVHRTIDADGLDVASNEVFGVTALTNEGSGQSRFFLDSDPTTTISDRFTVSHFATVARLFVEPRAGWDLVSVVCDERSFPLDSSGTGASVPLIDDTVCVLTSRRSSSTAPLPGITVIVRTLDAGGAEIEATDPADVFDFFAFDFIGWSASSTLDTNPSTAAPNRLTVEPPANADVFFNISLPVGGPRTWEMVSLVCNDGPPLVQTSGSIFMMSEPVVCTATVRLGAPATVQVTLETIDGSGAPIASANLIGATISSGGSESRLSLDTDPATANASTGSAVMPAGRALVSTGAPTGWRIVAFTCDTATPVPVPALSGRAFEVDVAGSTSCRLVLQQAVIELGGFKG